MPHSVNGNATKELAKPLSYFFCGAVKSAPRTAASSTTPLKASRASSFAFAHPAISSNALAFHNSPLKNQRASVAREFNASLIRISRKGNSSSHQRLLPSDTPSRASKIKQLLR
ncbi:hypothetical protein D6817_04445 [Candidatus Pacearchaeota archaeon]|nr:MAG: hypothetical protein D6817_04445 [Candidatus Pacearchaeota archaeon]